MFAVVINFNDINQIINLVTVFVNVKFLYDSNYTTNTNISSSCILFTYLLYLVLISKCFTSQETFSIYYGCLSQPSSADAISRSCPMMQAGAVKLISQAD